jgi:hypothetical protein
VAEDIEPQRIRVLAIRCLVPIRNHAINHIAEINGTGVGGAQRLLRMCGINRKKVTAIVCATKRAQATDQHTEREEEPSHLSLLSVLSSISIILDTEQYEK